MRRPLFSALVLQLVWSVVAAGQSLPSLTPLDVWGPAGTVNAVARDGDTLYVAGDVGYVGPSTDRFAVLAGATGALQVVPGVVGTPDCVAAVPGGGWIIAGYLALPGQSPSPRLVRLDATGSAIASWQVSYSGLYDSSGLVRFIVVDGNAVYFGGSIVEVNHATRFGLAAVDLATGALLPWHPVLANGGSIPILWDGLVHQGAVVVRGQFTTVNGQAASNFASLDVTTGALRPGSAGAIVNVYAMAAAGGSVFLAGLDSAITARGTVMSVATGAVVPWAIPTATPMSQLVASGSRVFGVTGGALFTVVELDPVTGTPFGPVFAAGGVVSRVSSDSGHLYLGIDRRGSAQEPREVVALPLSSIATPTWRVYANQPVSQVAESAGRVAVIGTFDSIGGVLRNGVYALDLRTRTVTAFDIPVSLAGPNPPRPIEAMVVIGGVLVVGGRSNGTSVALTALDRASGRMLWSPIFTASSAFASVEALATDGRALFVGGEFSIVDGLSRPNLVSFDLSSGRITDWVPAPDGRVNALSHTDGFLLVSGEFLTLANAARERGAALATALMALQTWNPALSFRPVGVAAAGGRVATVGTFSSAQGQAATGFAVFDANGARLPLVAPSRFFAGLRAVSGFGTQFLIAGATYANSSQVAILSAATGADLGWEPIFNHGPGTTGDVSRVARYSDITVVAGAFTHAGLGRALNLAVFPMAGPPPPIQVRARVTGSTLAMSWQPQPGSSTTSYILDGFAGGQLLASIPLSDPAFAVTAPAGTFTLRVRSVANGVVGTIPSLNVVVTAPAPAQAPAAPIALTALGTPGTAALSWTAGSGGGNLESFVIEAGSAPGGADLAVLDTGVLDPSFAASAPPGTYFVRVRAKNLFGMSLPSNEVVLVVP